MVTQRRPGTIWLAASVLGSALLGGCVQPNPNRDVLVGLQSEEPSERIEACVEAGRTGNAQAVPLLIERLEDPSADVRLFAISALRRITGRENGYRFYDAPAARAEAVARWRRWLKANVLARRVSPESAT